MRRTIDVLQRGAGAGVGLIVGVVIILLMLHTVTNAVGRSAFNVPVDGTLEYVANWYLPVVVLLGLVLAQQGGQHIEANLLYDRAPKRVQRELSVVAIVLTIIVCVIFVWYGLGEAQHAREIGRTAGTSGVTIWPVLFIVPVGFGLLALQCATDLVKSLLPKPQVETTEVGATV